MRSLARVRRPRLLAILSAVVLAAGSLVGAAAPASAAPAPQTTPHATNGDDLAPTPPMGFNDWAGFECNDAMNEQLFVDTADEIVRLGLDKLGYHYVNIDDCWMQHDRDADGHLQIDRTRFPHGLKWLGDYIHSKGLKFGIYEDAGYKTCQGAAGSYGHFQTDADDYASWGVDYLKLDYCYQPTDQFPGKSAAEVAHLVYHEASQALANTGRKIVFSESAPAYVCCSGPNFTDELGWLADEGQLWRYGSDIADNWDSVLENYAEGNSPGLAAYAGPNHWNDADMLEVGNGGMTTNEYQAQMSVWSVMASPLLFSTALKGASADTIRILSNADVVAVDQDRLGVQGTIVKSTGDVDILSRPLANGDRAVVLFNKGASEQTASVTAAQAGFTGHARSYRLTDLWSKQITSTAGTIAASVPGHSATLYRVHRNASPGIPPATVVGVDGHGYAAGTSTPTTVTLTNHGTSAISDATVRLKVPAGWTATRTDRRPARAVPPGGTLTAHYDVTPNTPPPGAMLHLTGSAGYRWHGTRHGVSGGLDYASPTPYPSIDAAANNVGVTDESNPAPGNFDGGGNSYSAQALAAAGLTPGASLTHDGLTFRWPSAAAGTPDNVAGGSRKVAVSGTGTLGFLGAEAGFDTGTVTITFTDGTTRQADLSFPNWCCSDTTGYDIVATADHRNTQSGPANFGVQYRIFYLGVALPPDKTVASVTLPAQSSIHVFAVAAG
ncbi:alpha-galactosidase [Actinocatenispora thailandica]|uniref:Alpha-galactosidase n=1 Tax=Actinocatenispora thailandica TaxID=227318 RepID=A0A7R7HW46_9ACTN|nr:NEW3 domain-containing protein [Actinocatenispora thailandica]BCJ33758.1 alpha-galactosidase [Actinocatenispora thailandica]